MNLFDYLLSTQPSTFFVKYFFFLGCVFSLSATAQTKVACIGNSVTYGYLVEHREQNAYPVQLQKRLGDGFQVENFGHSGATLLQKGHNPYVKTQEYADLLKFAPDIAFIHLGLNDTDPRNWPYFRDEFVHDYGQLIDTLRFLNPKVKITVCLMSPVFSGHPRFLSGTREWYAQEQTVIAKIAKAYHTELLDLNAVLYPFPNNYVNDFLHPNADGAKRIADAVYQKLTGNYGGLQLPKNLASHMVLQRNAPIPFRGVANADEQVKITWNGKTQYTTANSDGKWEVIFPALPAGGPYQLIVNTATQKVVLDDILMGDVWLCAGQSNMDFPFSNSKTFAQDKTHLPKQIRILHWDQIAKTNDVVWDSTVLKKLNTLEFFTGSWQNLDAENAPNFSAVAYYFGQKIQAETHVPIGLIQVSVGGSPIVSWVDRHTLEYEDALNSMMNNWLSSDFIMPWVRQRAKKNIELNPQVLQRHPYQPAYNFEAGMMQLYRAPLKGVLWYQGESDEHNVELYARNFNLLVKSWRNYWQQPHLPFYVVQLPSIQRNTWPSFRNMQRLLPAHHQQVFLTVNYDLGDTTNVHPTDKKPVGERLADAALAQTYHLKKGNYLSPIAPQVVSKQQGLVVIAFDHCKQLKTNHGKAVQGFELFTNKGARISATKVEIKFNKAYVYYPSTVQIDRVVYAWQPFTTANLQNELGFLVSTFELNL